MVWTALFTSGAAVVPQWSLCADCAEAIGSDNEMLVRFSARIAVGQPGSKAADLAETQALARFDQLRQEFLDGARLTL